MDQLAVCLLIFAVTVIGYCSGLYSIATISQISLIALTLTGCLSAKQALGYYSNSNVIMRGWLMGFPVWHRAVSRR